MDGHYFISYSRNDSPDLPGRLADQLAAGATPYRLWVDVRELQPWQDDWDDQIAYAIQTCRAVLFMMTPDSVRPDSGCKLEWGWALKYKKPVISLRLHPEAALPFRLQNRQYIDFTSGFDTGMARLRIFLSEVDSPQGVLRELRFRLADAERELPRAQEEGERARIGQEMADLRVRIVEQERVVADPAGAAAETDKRIAVGLEVQREPERPWPQRVARAKFVNPPPMTAPTYFQDRHVETELLAEFLSAEDTRLVTVVGRGGVGKTAMVCRLLKGVETGRLPDELGDKLGELPVDGIVYLRTPSAHPVSWANLFTDLCRLLPEQAAERLLQRYRDPHETSIGLMLALLEAIPAGRTVVLLDNFEDLLDPATGAVTEAALDEALRTVLSAPAHGVKIVITTRVAPQPLLLHHPGVQQRIDLDEGLPSPYAEQLLRARDPDGKLGLKTAADAQLSVARERTRGYPRALEALAAILSADRNTTLPELLAQTAQLPDNVVTALVGEAFLRLDPLAQLIMQALAIYPLPVPAVAIDYLLQPYQPAINAGPILARLVNMQFVRRDAGRYYLHQVDRDYALGRISNGDPDDRDADPPPFTRTALRHRGADYFSQTQTPREDWKTLDDLAPQLAEIELRQQGGDYDTAAEVLLAIDFNYLITWGHYRLTISLHTHLQDHLTDPWIRGFSIISLGDCHRLLGNYPRAIRLFEPALAVARDIGDRESEALFLGRLGICYGDLGQTQRAIEMHEQALTIAREFGDREAEAADLGNLGLQYGNLGQTQRAIEVSEQGLTIAREFGDREGEAAHLGNLGLRYAELGQTQRAIELHEQALTIARKIGHRQGQAIHLSNLGLRYADLGQTQRAIELHEQALTIDREIGHRPGEAADLNYLANSYADLGQTEDAVDLLQQAIDIADAVGYAQVQAEARRDLAQTQLWSGDLAAARQTIDAAYTHRYPPTQAAIALIDGIIYLTGSTMAVAEAFRETIALADQRLEHNLDDYESLDTKALALIGLTLTGTADHATDAIAGFRAARSRTAADGITARVQRYLDTLTPADPTDILHHIYPIATGRTP